MAHVDEKELPALIRAINNYPTMDVRMDLQLLAKWGEFEFKKKTVWNIVDERHIELALAHVKDGVSGVYNKAQYLQDRANMMQWYVNHLRNSRSNYYSI